MREKPIHLKIFDIYYALGDGRSLMKLRDKLKEVDKIKSVPSLATLKRWSIAFNWQKRIEQRDIELKKKMKDTMIKETDKAILNTKADYRREIKQAHNLINALLNSIFERNKQGKIVRLKVEVKTINDVARLLQIKDILMKTDLQLIGEDIDRAFKVTIEEVENSNEQAAGH